MSETWSEPLIIQSLRYHHRKNASLELDTLGFADDAALLTPNNKKMVSAMDTMVEGVHFLPDDPPETIAHKIIATNLSDMAAMGAKPLAMLLSLSLSNNQSSAWVDAFLKHFFELEQTFACPLIGGDTTKTPGPLTLSICALGTVENGQPLLRSNVKPNDLIYCSGTIGDAHLGLLLRTNKIKASCVESESFLINRYRCPTPRLDLGMNLYPFSKAAIDISDGLLHDAQNLATASNVDILIYEKDIPLSSAAQKIVGEAQLDSLVTGGDDYELLIAINPSHRLAFEDFCKQNDHAVTLIGQALDPAREPTVFWINRQGDKTSPIKKGWEHHAFQPSF